MLRHPNIQHEWSDWSERQKLHIVAVYSNPFRYRNRRQTFHNFLDRMRQAANVVLHVVEVAYGSRPFEMTSEANPLDVQLRTREVLWVKENAFNIALSRFNWQYAGYFDGDFIPTRHDWALEAVQQLQHHDWVQLYSGYGFMSPDHKPVWTRPSFGYVYGNDSAPDPNAPYIDNSPYPGGAAVGGGWAFTRQSFDAVGGMLDTCILGSADWYMAYGLIGRDTTGRDELKECAPGYLESLKEWQAKAFAAIQGNIGYISNFCLHEWHGDIRKRGYETRERILAKHAFDPATDLVKDDQGLIQFAGNKPALRRDVIRYFQSRCEDVDHLTYATPY